MPHISIKCYPKHLGDAQLARFSEELTALVCRHLSASDGDVSVDYREIPAEEWKTVYDNDIRPRMDRLLKKPGYSM